MKTKNHKSKNNLVSGVFVAISGIACGLWLLISLDKITGAEFVTLSLGFAMIGLIIAFAAEVQEFSIAGNGVKLKELRLEAERTIEDLKQDRTEVFRLMLPQVLEGSQTTLRIVDPRIKVFLKLYEQIEKFNLNVELEEEINKVLKILLICQYGNLIAVHKTQNYSEKDFQDLMNPREFLDLMNDSIVDSFMQFHSNFKNFYEARKALNEGIEAYAKLYAIKVKLDKLENEL